MPVLSRVKPDLGSGTNSMPVVLTGNYFDSNVQYDCVFEMRDVISDQITWHTTTPGYRMNTKNIICSTPTAPPGMASIRIQIDNQHTSTTSVPFAFSGKFLLQLH